MRLDWVLRRKDIAYKEETCQFLATLAIIHTETGMMISFATSNGKVYSGTLETWERILGIPANGQAELNNELGESAQLWNFIANGVYQPGRSKSAMIRNPAI
ncbi:unnamed protein product [Cochlearia groenlandica]